jgi:hypothetical protein
LKAKDSTPLKSGNGPPTPGTERTGVGDGIARPSRGSNLTSGNNHEGRGSPAPARRATGWPGTRPAPTPPAPRPRATGRPVCESVWPSCQRLSARATTPWAARVRGGQRHRRQRHGRRDRLRSGRHRHVRRALRRGMLDRARVGPMVADLGALGPGAGQAAAPTTMTPTDTYDAVRRWAGWEKSVAGERGAR